MAQDHYPHKDSQPAGKLSWLLRAAVAAVAARAVGRNPYLWLCPPAIRRGEHVQLSGEPITFGRLLYHSGETFFTLGYGDIVPTSPIARLLAVLEAGMGFGFLGTVIGYLPTIYSAFSRREIQISLLDARAGSP